MIPFFPTSIAKKGLSLYFISLIIVTVLFMDYALGIPFFLIGFVWVVGFFLLSSYCSKKWLKISQKEFQLKVFFAALGLRFLWVFFSYYFYLIKTGIPFEFATADALGYYDDSLWYSQSSVSEMWRELFINRKGVSDSGYVFYLSLLAKMTGKSIILPRLVNSMFSAVTCVLIYLLAKRNIGEEGGRLASLFACFMPNLIYYCGLHLKETVMLFLIVAFLERTDYLFRSKHYTVLTVVIPVVLLLSLFTFRTVLGAACAFAFVSGLVFTSSSVIKRRKRIMLILWGVLAAVTLAGGVIMNEIESTWDDRANNQINKRATQTAKGNLWAKYATGTVMAPMIFVLPFPTMVDVDEQYNQQIVSGGNYVRNFMGGFVLLAFFSAIFVKKNWRDMSLIITYVVAYLGIISVSGFANSERFLLPGIPILLVLAAYGITLLNAKNYRLFKIWCWIVPVMIVGWAVFKLGSRGLL